MDDGAGGKCPRRVHLEAMVRQGDPEAEIELYHGPTLPPATAYLWSWWLDLCQTRGGSGFGLNPIDRHDIQQFAEDEALIIEAWERRAIIRLDGAYRQSLIPDEQPKEATT